MLSRFLSAAAILLLATTLLVGCAVSPKKDQNKFAEAVHQLNGETRERVIRASAMVLAQSDSNFNFEYSLSGFTGFRPYVINAVIAVQTGTERWVLQTEQAPEGVRASIGVSENREAHGIGSAPSRGEGAMGSVPLYRLFWTRVEYVLGQRSDWTNCDTALAELDKQNINGLEALSGICGLTSNGRNSPPPERLPALSPQSPVPAAKAKIHSA